MKCPRCVQYIHRGAEICPHCGFSVRDVDELFGFEDIKLSCFTDAAGVFRKKERECVAKVVERFNKQFPELFIAVYFSALGDATSIRQHAFWLLNRSIFEDTGSERLNSGGVILLVDVASKEATISYGYRVEPYLNEEDTFRMLSAAHPSFLQGQYLQAVSSIGKKLAAHLRKRSRQARRNPGRFGDVRETLDVPVAIDESNTIPLGEQEGEIVQEEGE